MEQKVINFCLSNFYYTSWLLILFCPYLNRERKWLQMTLQVEKLSCGYKHIAVLLFASSPLRHLSLKSELESWNWRTYIYFSDVYGTVSVYLHGCSWHLVNVNSSLPKKYKKVYRCFLACSISSELTQGLAVMVFSTDETSNKALVCAGVPNNGAKDGLVAGGVRVVERGNGASQRKGWWRKEWHCSRPSLFLTLLEK